MGKGAERNASTAGMRWLRHELDREPPWKAHLEIGELDGAGHRGGERLNLEVVLIPESPGWVGLHAYVREDRFTDSASARRPNVCGSTCCCPTRTA